MTHVDEHLYEWGKLCTWMFEFDKEETHDDQFNLPDGVSSPCKMMMQTNEFEYFDTDKFQAIQLPYGSGNLAMTILLPRSGEHVDNLIDTLDPQNWNQWLTRFSRDSVTLELPRFEIKYKRKLNDVLKTMGMGIAFSPGANFTNMSKPGGIWIDYVKHKSFVKVDEEGTEAAAVTIVAMERISVGGGSQIQYMRVDRPFVFVIHERQTNTLLFMGKIVEPGEG